MARTDKTRPWYVKALDRPSFLVEAHDHRFGACDLPQRPTKEVDCRAGTVYSQHRCEWVVSQEFNSDRASYCGCWLCTDQFERKIKARRQRAAGRHYVKNWQHEY